MGRHCLTKVFILELQRVGKPGEERYIAAAVELALATGLPVVATNDVRFIHQKDFAAHEVAGLY